MYKVLGVVEDKFLVSEDGGQEEIVSAEELVLGISYGQEFDGCEYGPKGLKVWFEGQEPYDVEVEVWKPVIYRRKYDGVLLTSDSYVVSNLGRVRSLERKSANGHHLKEKVLEQSGVGYNNLYRSVTLSNPDGKRGFLVHILVGLAYLPNVDNLPIINHKDENTVNNSAYNLEWCTYLYNNTYGSRIDRFVASKSYRVRQYSYYGKFIKEFASANEAAKSCGCHASSIRNCCTGVLRSVCGFIWRYSLVDELIELSEDDRVVAVFGNNPRYLRGIRQYSTDGEFVAEYASVSDASNSSGATVSDICNSIIDLCRVSQGHLWRYMFTDEFADRPENAKAIEEFRKKMEVL